MTDTHRYAVLTLYHAALVALALLPREATLRRSVLQLVCDVERALELPRTHQSRREREG